MPATARQHSCSTSRDWGFHLPTIVGHRGVTETGPENTLFAIERAKREGATWVEFDVQLSADMKPLLFHDATLDRTTDGKGRLRDFLAADLVKMSAGRWFNRKYDDAKIPTLEDTIALCRDLDLGMNIEIKPGLGDPARTAAEAVASLNKLNWKDREQVLISSFKHEALVSAMELAPKIPRGYLLHKIPLNWWSLLQSVEATTLHTCYKFLTQTQQEQIELQSYPIMLYSVDDPLAALAMRKRGLDCLCTGAPGLISKVVERAGYPL